jgi:NADH oxidase (H2O2-forming)
LVRDALVAAGIEVMVGAHVSALSGHDQVSAVVTDRGPVQADTVVLATGIRPSVTLAEEAGLKTGRTGGIVTDARLRTSDPDIWACGDCIESLDVVTGLPVLSMLWPNAKAQGAIAGTNAIGGDKIYAGSFSFVTVNLLDTFVFRFGSTSGSLANCAVAEQKSTKGYIRLIMTENRLAGVQIIGDDTWRGVTSAILNRRRVAWRSDHGGRKFIPQLTSTRLMRLVNNMVS